MENYKVEIFDENTFKSKGIVDTQIPEILVKTIQESLDKLNDELVRTPLVLNEEELVPSFGIMVKDEKGLHHLKYLVNISLFKQAKEIQDENLLEMLHKFGFDYTYNYRGEKTIYEWIPEWFEEYKRLLTI
jgi:hypothetical protein